MARLDLELVLRGLVASRSRASDLIRRGFVVVDGVVAKKSGCEVDASMAIALADASPRYVSRGAEKLVAALDHFGFAVEGRHAVDIGASTGGFTEVLLERGAASVVAVDVGHDQLHSKLRADKRVQMLESRDARTLAAADFTQPVSAVTADVSFISLEKALPAVLALAARGTWLVALVKPQFEVGRDAVGKRGIVRDEAAAEAAVTRIESWLAREGWQVAGRIASPIKGGDGNQEYLVGATKRGVDG